MSGAWDFASLFLLAGLCAFLLAGFPVAFTLAGTSILFAGIGWIAGFFDGAFLTAFPQAVFSVMTNEVLVAVPLFVLMGVFLERSRVAEDLLAALGTLCSGLPGGLAVSVAGVGVLLAASTGIVGATVVTMGVLALPVMMRRGYDPGFAAGSIAASGTLGQIIPPSIVLVLLGDQMSNAYQNAQFASGVFSPDAVAVSDFFAGALIPGLLLALLYGTYQVVFGLLNPDRAPRYDAARDERAPSLVRSLVAPVGLIIAVLGSILGGLASPSEAAGIGAVGALLLAGMRCDPSITRSVVGAATAGMILAILSGYPGATVPDAETSGSGWFLFAIAIALSLVLAFGVFRALVSVSGARTLDGDRVLSAVLDSTLMLTAMIFMIVIAARLFAIVFRGYGGDVMIESLLSALPGGAAGAVLAVMLAMFLMGFFLDFLEIVFIVVPIVAPVLLMMQLADGSTIDPVWLGVMMAINLQTSFLTPPFGFALFYLRGAAPDDLKTGDLYRGVLPFIGLQLLALGLVWWFPSLATALPEALTRSP
ncbi:MAG: TRAP transporter large permease subunit [Pseudomonadota bacterium]